MSIESRASRITAQRALANFVSFVTAFGITMWLIVAVTDTNDPAFFFILVPLYALFSITIDWISSKLNARWFKEVDSEFVLEQQKLTIKEFKLYLDLILKIRLIRMGVAGIFAAIAFIFSSYPLFIFAFIYFASFIASLCYLSIKDIKIPEDLHIRFSTEYAFVKERIENNPAIIGSAANSMRRHS